MKLLFFSLALLGAVLAGEQRYRRSILGLGYGAPGLISPGLFSQGLIAPGLISPASLLAGSGALIAPAAIAPAAIAPAAIAPAAVAPAAIVPPAAPLARNLGPTAGAATIRGPGGTIHAPAVTAGLGH